MDVSLALVAALGLVVIVGAVLFTRRRVEAAPAARSTGVDEAAPTAGSPPREAPVTGGSTTPTAAASGEAPPAPAPYDPVEALELCGGDPEFLKTIFAELPNECRQRMADLNAALAAGDAAAQRAAAHRMKGSLLVIGARPAVELARQLEHAGAAGEVGPRASVDALERALDELYAAIARAG